MIQLKLLDFGKKKKILAKEDIEEDIKENQIPNSYRMTQLNLIHPEGKVREDKFSDKYQSSPSIKVRINHIFFLDLLTF